MNAQHGISHQATARTAAVGMDPGIEKKYFTDSLASNLEGFIHHPPGFELTWKRIRNRFMGWQYPVLSEQGNIGLCFHSEKYIKPGTLLQLSISLRGETQEFTGRVVLVKNSEPGYQIGVWFISREDGSRIRIVEQICHIESYLRHKRHHDGPFFSKERVTAEWINRFASSFPSFG